jgi:DNA polymerase III sliding clamp (beta) subunit (PCNA family)
MIKIGEVELFIRMIEKKFPDYKVIIPREEYKKAEVIIEKGKIKPALKRISIISQENNSPVVFSFKDKKMEIFTEDSELGNIKETLEIEKKEKKDFSFCINSVYLLDILNAVNNNIIIEYNIEEEDKPIIIRENNRKKRSKYIIMPMVLD